MEWHAQGQALEATVFRCRIVLGVDVAVEGRFLNMNGVSQGIHTT